VFTSKCSVLVCFTNCVYFISNCCFFLASEHQLSYMKQYACIHSDINLAIFCIPPMYFPLSLEGCNSLMTCLRHLGISMEQEKFFKSSIVFLNIRFNHLYNFVIFYFFLLVNNSIKLKYKVTFVVRKQRNTSYIFCVDFVLNLN